MKYAFFDGDNVGDTLEILLIEDRLQEAQELSNNISKALAKIKETIGKEAETIIIGGDDLLIKIHDNTKVEEIINNISKIFKIETKLTISCGVGGTIQASINQLRLAKIYGKNQTRIEGNGK